MVYELIGLSILCGVISATVYTIYTVDKKIVKITGEKVSIKLSDEQLRTVVQFLRSYKSRNPIARLHVDNYLRNYNLEAKNRQLEI